MCSSTNNEELINTESKNKTSELIIEDSENLITTSDEEITNNRSTEISFPPYRLRDRSSLRKPERYHKQMLYNLVYQILFRKP
jgi:hypothetical protein